MTIVICAKTLAIWRLICTCSNMRTKTSTTRLSRLCGSLSPSSTTSFYEPEALNSNGIMLKWLHRDFDYEFIPSQLSDGSLRFICLVTALLQPDPPSTIIIDEPEIGLHPYAITLLGALLHSASERMQIIVATQSVALVNQFSIDELIIAELKDGSSVFKRYKEREYELWLEDYSVGELWEKNVLGGRLS